MKIGFYATLRIFGNYSNYLTASIKRLCSIDEYTRNCYATKAEDVLLLMRLFHTLIAELIEL